MYTGCTGKVKCGDFDQNCNEILKSLNMNEIT